MDVESFLPDRTISAALSSQLEAVAALRAQVAENPYNTNAARELSMAAKRLAEMVEKYELEKRIEALENEQTG